MRQYRQPRAMDRQPNLAGPQVFGTRWALSGLMAVYRERGERKRFETTWLGTPQGPALSAL